MKQGVISFFSRLSKHENIAMNNFNIAYLPNRLAFCFVLIILFGSTLKAQPIHATPEKIQIDLLEIHNLSIRLQFYDYLRKTLATVSEPQAGIIEINTDSVFVDYLKTKFALALDSIRKPEKLRDKTTSSNIMLNLSDIYGEDLLTKAMGRENINDFCRKSFPFCTTSIYTFPAGVNSGGGEPGPNYGCLSTTPNPAWYHMKILTPGDITIKMESYPLEDIDYIIWGPFENPTDPCNNQLMRDKIVSCSYSPDPIEFAEIPNGQIDEYYILLITNYSNRPCEITFSKTGGTGETDCSILPPPISSNSPVCFGDDLLLSAVTQYNATFSWTGPNGFSSNEQNPVIHNAQPENSGTYILEITINDITSDPVSLEVEIIPVSIPDFDVEDVCFGESNQFTDLSTVIPQNETITTYKWLFGDGTSSSEQNPLHTYNTAGSYEVSLMTYTAQGQCERKITKEVSVKPLPIVNAGEDQTILDSWTALLKGSVEGGSGDYSFQWTPANQLADPSNLLTNTLKLNATTHFTLTVTDNDGGCVSEDEVVIYFAYVFLPNAFKPNSNIESNQLLKPIGALEAIKNFEFLIYSRWGQLVFKTNSSKEGWDGTFNGKSLPAATYVWLMRYEIIENSFLAPGEILKRGTVNLVP